MEKILVIGSGARENAIAEALKKNKDVKIYSCQEYNNYGITRISEDVLDTEKDSEKILEFCNKNNIDFCIIGPEAALERGIVNILNDNGYPCASPTKEAAKIETDKAYARQILDKYQINGQIKYKNTSDIQEAIKFCESLDWKVAVKPIGLTSGKGVKVWGDHLKNPIEVRNYIEEILTNQIGNHSAVILEELLIGQEFTIHFFCDGNNAFPTPPAQDHKRAFDFDEGPNTGGMGSYSIDTGLPFLKKEEYEVCSTIGQDVINALKKEGHPFKGILYGQFILTKNGPKIIEFNSRFGDPEAMNTLMLLDSDYATICKEMIKGTLNKDILKFKKEASLVYYVVPIGYGENPKQDEEVTIDEKLINSNEAKVFYGSCNFVEENLGKVKVKTTKSRTLALCSTGKNLEDIYQNITKLLKTIDGDVYYRKDIGSKESIKKKINMMNDLTNIDNNIM